MDSLFRPNDGIEDLLDIPFPVVAVPEVATHDPIPDIDDVPELIHQVGAAVIAVPEITKMIKATISTFVSPIATLIATLRREI